MEALGICLVVIGVIGVVESLTRLSILLFIRWTDARRSKRR